MDKEKVILDVTTLVTLISDTSHRPNVYLDHLTKFLKENKKDEYHQKVDCIYREIRDELDRPLYPILKKRLDGKEICMLRESVSRVENFMLHIMNDIEVNRFREFLKTVTILDTNISDRIDKLTDKSWRQSNKAVFGTADKLKLRVFTANQKVAHRLLKTNNFDMLITVHRSRDFVGSHVCEIIGYVEN